MSIKSDILTLLNDGTVDAIISDSQVEPITDCAIVSVQIVDESYRLDGQTQWNIKQTTEIYIQVQDSDTYVEFLDALVLQVKLKILTSASLVSKHNIMMLNVNYFYRDAGDTNIASAKITLESERQELIQPVYDASAELLRINTKIDKDFNGSIDKEFLIVRS